MPEIALNNLINKLDSKYFFFDLPLYETIVVEHNDPVITNLLQFEDEFDAYNFRLKENSTFEGIEIENRINYPWFDNRKKYIFNVKIKCKRTDEIYNFYILKNDLEFQKIGQYPSLADLQIGQIQEYKNVLSKEKLKEFIRAIGLRAHGVGIGSFVYLRRIFEYLIEEEHKKAKKENDWDEGSFKKFRMDEKINSLKEYLPDFLVENKDLYGILSSGIHQLSEEECLRYFDSIRIGIEQILEEKIVEFNKSEKRKKAVKEVTLLREAINKN